MYNQPTTVPYLPLKFTHSYDLPTLSDSQDSLSVLISVPLEEKKENENICKIMVGKRQALVYGGGEEIL